MSHPDGQLRVLHLTTASDEGGISRYLYDVCMACSARGHVTQIAGARGNWHDLFEDSGLKWIEAPVGGGPWSLWRSVRQLAQYLQDHPVDLLHAHYRKASLVGRALARRLDLPLLYTLHLPGFPVRGPWQWFSEFGDHSHAVSNQARQWLIDAAGVARQRITVVPHGVDSQRFAVADRRQQSEARRQLDLPQEALVAAFVDRFAAQKNPRWMLDLAEASREKLPELLIVMMGDGPDLPELQRRVERQRLGDRIRLLGYDDPLALYNAADALLLPSREEGFGLVCTEAMSVGRPVLRTRTAGCQEQIIENVNGRSVPVDRDQFIAAAIEFFSDSQRLWPMGQAAAEHVRRHMTFDVQIDRTLQLYRSVIEHQRRPAPQSPEAELQPAARPAGSVPVDGDGALELDRRHQSPWNVRQRILRIVWMLVQATIFRFSFHNAYKWRAMLMRLFGARIGKSVKIRPTARFEIPWQVRIGDNTAIGDFAIIYNLGWITIGKRVTISQYAHLCAGSHDYRYIQMPLLRPPISIGDDVWVAADAFVGPGVTIGDRAILGARASAFKDLPPDVIAAGNPAKPIKKRLFKNATPPASAHDSPATP